MEVNFAILWWVLVILAMWVSISTIHQIRCWKLIKELKEKIKTQ